MIRATTPTLTLRIINNPDIDLTQATNVYVTIASPVSTITKTGPDVEVEAQSVSCWLTQEETLSFRQGDAEVQLNWTYADADGTKRAATRIKKVNIGRQLLPEVVE